jgi:YD repeat-containing protein
MTLGRVPAADESPRPIREVRWSARRKMEVVLRLLRGESLETVRREVRIEGHRLAAWRDEFLDAGVEGLKARPRAPDERRLSDAERKVGDNGLGRVSTVLDPTDTVTRYQYDRVGRVTSTVLKRSPTATAPHRARSPMTTSPRPLATTRRAS